MSPEWTPPYGYEKNAVKPPEFKAESESIENQPQLSEMQQEAEARINEIDSKLDRLKIIIASNLQKGVERPDAAREKENLRQKEDALETAYVSGDDTKGLETELSDLRSTHAENKDFYGQQNDRMFKARPASPEELTASNRLVGVAEENLSDEMRSLLSTLEDMGLSKDEFVREVSEKIGHLQYEDRAVDSVLEEFRNRLILERNRERLAFPDELFKMTGELVRTTKVKKNDFTALANTIKSYRDRKLSLEAAYEGIPASSLIDQYPTEVQERYYRYVAKLIYEEIGSDVASREGESHVTELGKSMAEYRAYSSEKLRYPKDIERDIEAQKKILEFGKQEEEYLLDCIKADKKLTLPPSPSIDSGGLRFDPSRPEEWTDQDPEWPVLAYEVKSEEHEIKYRGSTNSQSYAHTGGWKQVMREAYALLKTEFPYERMVSPVEVIIALREAIKKTHRKLEELEAEREQRAMHEAYLQKIRTRTFSL